MHLKVNGAITIANSLLNTGLIMLMTYLFGAGVSADVAFGVNVGVFGVVISNFGSDQVQQRYLIKSDTLENLYKLVINNLLLRTVLLTCFLISLFFYIDEFELVDNLLFMYLSVIWACMYSLQPNATVDFLQKHLLQSLVTLVERVGSIVTCVLIYFFYDVEPTDKITPILIALLLFRAVNLLYVTRTCIYSASNLSFNAIDFSKDNFFNEKFGVSFSVALSNLSLAVVAYYSLVVMKDKIAPIDYVVYTLVFQIFNFGLLLQHTMVRQISSSLNSLVYSKELTVNSIMRVAKPVVLATFVISFFLPTVSLVLVWIYTGKLDVNYVICSFVFSLWINLTAVGQVVTKITHLSGLFQFYLLINICGAIFSLFIGPSLINNLGYVGAALSILVVHGFLIVSNFIYVAFCVK